MLRLKPSRVVVAIAGVAACAVDPVPATVAVESMCVDAACAAPEPQPLPRSPIPNVEADAGVDAAPPGPPPSPTDGVKNGDETDIDCGGASASTPRCAAHRGCLAGTDCATSLCGSAGPGKNKCLVAKSCTGAAGTWSCGLAGDDDCCRSLPVPGGAYERFDDPNFPATVSAFGLDVYEITVGRMRAFFAATGGNPKAFAPAPGAAAHPRVPGSGWRSSFNVRLPASWAEIDARLGATGCARGGDNADGGAATWTPAPGPYEEMPITCADWYTLFAFCAWDGGRLPTSAEWGFAAQGGSEQRPFAWSKAGDPSTYLLWGVHDGQAAVSLWDEAAQVYKFGIGTPFRAVDPVTGRVNDGPAHMTPPGRTKGYGRWGHADLTGNVLEFSMDNTPTPPGTCTDCARVDWPDPPQTQVGYYPINWVVGEELPDGQRSLRGGSWDPTHVPWAWFEYGYAIARTYYAAGARCARD